MVVWRVAAVAKPNWKPRLMPQTTRAAAAAGSSFKKRRQPRCWMCSQQTSAGSGALQHNVV